MNRPLPALARIATFTAALFLAGCPAIYPEIGTRIRKITADQALDPPPPDNLMWMKFESARVPDRTRG
ncbi:MAG: hypothetical protein L6Q76_25280, partial [Polyangiaceae bacterium]|nr:hypothetical protein [Polyangiaceae bacterium]